MSRSSLRLKSTVDFNGGGGGNGSANKNGKNGGGNGITLINYKRSSESSFDSNQLNLENRDKSKISSPASPSVFKNKDAELLAPIAQDEDLDSCLNEPIGTPPRNGHHVSSSANSTPRLSRNNTLRRSPSEDTLSPLNSDLNSGNNNNNNNSCSQRRRASLPHQAILDTAKQLLKKTSSNNNSRRLFPSTSMDSPSSPNPPTEEPFWGSDLEDELEAAVAKEDEEEEEDGGFESDEEDEKEKAAVARSISSNPPSSSTPTASSLSFTKTRSLREKLRDSSRMLAPSRRSVERELSNLTSPGGSNANSLSSNDSGAAAAAVQAQSNSEGRLSRLFSLRRSIGPGSSSLDSVPSASSPSTAMLSSISTSSVINSTNNMPRLPEEEEGGARQSNNSIHPAARGNLPPPSLPTMPSPGLLSPEQMKRRHIVSSLVHSENNYVASLQRLVLDYKKPLEESSPPILSSAKVNTLFHRVQDILHCHLVFRIALSEAAKNWDAEEKIGDVFVASFSKAQVLETYSDFINNFTNAMDCAKQEAKRKSAMADFLKVKQITAHDRVSFFGLMVKPVQRFPQFILLLQDLLKETPPGHPDRMALQLALTTLESLAEMLNERKRESEQFAAFRDKMRSISGKFAARSLMAQAAAQAQQAQEESSASNNRESPNGSAGGAARFLLKEDDVAQLEFSPTGQISRSKQRRLLLLNDLLLCVSVAGRASEVDFPSPVGSGQGGSGERLSLKWAVPVQDVEIVDGAAGGTLARFLAPSAASSSSSGFNISMSKRASLGRVAAASGSGSNLSENNSSTDQENLAQDMADLMHDFDVVSRIAAMIGTLRSNYSGLTTSTTSQILSEIQRSIRQKDEEMSFQDACCLQLCLKSSRSGGSSGSSSVSSGSGIGGSYTFQMRDPGVKKEWIVELRLAQLALDPNNSPGWDVLEQERSISTKMPLYVKSLPVQMHLSPEQVSNARSCYSEVTCGASYSLMVPTPTRTLRKQTYVWVNAARVTPQQQTHLTPAPSSSQLRIFSVPQNHQTGLKELGTIQVGGESSNEGVRAVVFVPGLNGGVANVATGSGADRGQLEDSLKCDTVWVGTDANRIVVYSASEPERGFEVCKSSAQLPSAIAAMSHHCESVWVGMQNGQMAVYRRDPCTFRWDLDVGVQLINLGSEPVTCLFPMMNVAAIYAACGKRIWVVDAYTGDQVKSFLVQPRPHQQHPLASASLSSPPSLSATDSSSGAKDPMQHQSSFGGAVHQMAQSGVGLWVALKNSATICLYHTETFRHLQDINIASNVSRVLAARDVTQPQRSIHVTALMASRGLLWVGTNVGIALTVPLPRLEGVPIISGRANISYHAHFGPVTFFLNLQHRVITDTPASPPSLSPLASSSSNNAIREEDEDDENECKSMPPPQTAVSPAKHGLRKQSSEGSIGESPAGSSDKLPETTDAPVKLRRPAHHQLMQRPPSPLSTRRRSRDFKDSATYNPAAASSSSINARRASKTLPRGFSLQSPDGVSLDGGEDGNVFGLYGELLNVRDYDCDSGDIANRNADGELRRSDPELNTIPYRVNTLDRRVRMKTNRPRSLDMSSTWSVESRGSAVTNTSSSSEAGSERPSPSVSRNASFQSNSGVAQQQQQQQHNSRSPVRASNQEEKKSNQQNQNTQTRKKVEQQRTVTTLMGGRGYINWRRAAIEKGRGGGSINNCDAYLVIWEMKL